MISIKYDTFICSGIFFKKKKKNSRLSEQTKYQRLHSNSIYPVPPPTLFSCKLGNRNRNFFFAFFETAT